MILAALQHRLQQATDNLSGAEVTEACAQRTLDDAELGAYIARREVRKAWKVEREARRALDQKVATNTATQEEN